MTPDIPRTGPARRPVMAPAADRAGPRPGDTVRGPLGYGRETVESIVVAFTLALLFRTFEAEAFVIPTGSMAPTLMGRHKDLACTSCGREFRVGCSAEEDDQSQSLRTEQSRLERELEGLKAGLSDRGLSPAAREAARRRVDTLESDRGPLAQLRTRLAAKMVPAAKCPNCGRVIRLIGTGGGAVPTYDPRYPSFNGDRILVNKFAYDFSAPDRWDVVVFKYPEDAKTNYIKRLVGLPGETLSISAGDIWTSRQEAPPVIARKPPAKLRAMLQCVHDSRFVSAELRRGGWPLAWTDWSLPNTSAPAWRSEDDGRSYFVVATGSPATLRYRHFLPTAEDWAALEQGEQIGERARPRLIDDFQPYNAIATRPHWVGDLAVECRLESRGPGGTVAFDLVEAGRAHRCTIDLGDGTARLELPDAPADAAPRAPTPVRGRGSWRILFANVDDELALFVDGRPVAFDRPTLWTRSIDEAEASLPDERPAEPGASNPGDLAPAGITASGADLRVADLRVLRDVYYIGALDIGARPGELIERERLEFPLQEGQYFVLGDNSAASKDSRMWIEGHHVDRELLIGRALVIFWPHAVPAKWSVPVKIGGVELRLPCWPNFARMGFVR